MPRTPRVSIIIPAYRAQGTLPTVLNALRRQQSAATEVLVVDSSGGAEAAALERSHPWVRVVGLAERVLPGSARNLGARDALGSRLAFLDADAVPGPNWLARLEAALVGQSWAGVAGAVLNGTPGSSVGTASYLLEFSELTAGRGGAPLHGATCNLLVDRHAFEAAGGFCVDVWPGEDTILTAPWARAKRMGFAPDATVWHLNRTSMPALLRHQYRLGRSFAMVCDRVDLPYGRFSRWPLLATAPAMRFGALVYRMSRQPGMLRTTARISHLLALGLASWGAGVAGARAPLRSLTGS